MELTNKAYQLRKVINLLTEHILWLTLKTSQKRHWNQIFQTVLNSDLDSVSENGIIPFISPSIDQGQKINSAEEMGHYQPEINSL